MPRRVQLSSCAWSGTYTLKFVPHALAPLQVLLLDEITVDLDVLGRAELMAFLKDECITRGATVRLLSVCGCVEERGWLGALKHTKQQGTGYRLGVKANVA